MPEDLSLPTSILLVRASSLWARVDALSEDEAKIIRETLALNLSAKPLSAQELLLLQALRIKCASEEFGGCLKRPTADQLRWEKRCATAD